MRYLPASTPAAPLTVVIPRQPGHEYDVDHYDGELYITTNKGAKNFKVVKAPVADPSERNWTTFIEHKPGLRIGSLIFFARHLVVAEREGGLSYLRVVDMKTRASHRIRTEEPDYALSLAANPEYDTTTVRFNYQSMVTPSSVYDYDMTTKQRTLLKRTEVLGGYAPDAYESRRIWAVARDGTKVPVSLVYRKGTKLDGSAPMLLYAYGSYGASQAPTFSSARLSLLDRGVVYALAYIRGGGELGEEWREQGRMMQKMNTFTDFIDCADHLVKNKYTSAGRLVIQGGSAGGLLMGAVVNMRPDLFKAAVAQVPFVDVNQHDARRAAAADAASTSSGATRTTSRFRLHDQVLALRQRQGAGLPIDAGARVLNDSQVPYWEGAKLVARLRATKTDTNPLLLKTNFGAGHGGASGRYDALRETAFTYAYMLWQMGVATGDEGIRAVRQKAEGRQGIRLLPIPLPSPLVTDLTARPTPGRPTVQSTPIQDAIVAATWLV